MSGVPEESLSIVVEREVRHAPEKVWRALTQPHLIEEWLMRTDFQPAVGHRFDLRAGWGVVDCEVQAVEPHRMIAYSWNAGRLRSVVTWTLTPCGTGTRLRMEQTGFESEQSRHFRGASDGWPQMFSRIEHMLDRLERSDPAAQEPGD